MTCTRTWALDPIVQLAVHAQLAVGRQQADFHPRDDRELGQVDFIVGEPAFQVVKQP